MTAIQGSSVTGTAKRVRDFVSIVRADAAAPRYAAPNLHPNPDTRPACRASAASIT